MLKRTLQYINLEDEQDISIDCKVAEEKGMLGPWVFRDLPKEIEIRVTVAGHDIKYKEQEWGIPRRTITYKLRRVDRIQEAIRLAGDLYEKNEHRDAFKEWAKYGVDRYYKIVTDENVKGNIKELGVVKIYNNKGLFENLHQKCVVYLKENIMRKEKMEHEKVRKEINEKVYEALHLSKKK